MGILINLMKDKGYATFCQLLDELEQDNFELKWSKKDVEQGVAKLALIQIIEVGKDENNEPVYQKTVQTFGTIFIGAMFCTSFPNKRPILPQQILDNYEEIIIKQNYQLLQQLYLYSPNE